MIRKIHTHAKLSDGPIARLLVDMSYDERSTHLDRLLRRWLGEVVHQGIPRPDGTTLLPQTSFSVHYDVNALLVRAIDSLGSSMSEVVRSVVRIAELQDSREHLEIEYRHRGFPGDPRSLGESVLRAWLDNDPPTLDRLAVRELSIQVATLQGVVDELMRRYDSRPVRATGEELLKMSNAALRSHLIRLGGRAPRDATKADLLSLIRTQEKLQ